MINLENLKNNCRKLIERYGKERIAICGVVILVIIVTLWIAQWSPTEDPSTELGLSIPVGQLVVPLELANSAALNGLVNRTAVVDLFTPGDKNPFVESLRILKLSNGDGTLFGALVPEKLAGQLQDAFSKSKLRAAIRATQAAPTQFHVHVKNKSTLLEVPIGE